MTAASEAAAMTPALRSETPEKRATCSAMEAGRMTTGLFIIGFKEFMFFGFPQNGFH
jgi:hypothetical protein